MSRQIQMTQGNCTTCQEIYEAGQTHCVCGRPTPYASFEERAAYEVAAWRAHKERREQAAV